MKTRPEGYNGVREREEGGEWSLYRGRLQTLELGDVGLKPSVRI